MPNPQLEDGYIKISNELWNAICKIRISGEAMQMLNTIIFKTYGWNKKEDKISTSQFIKFTGLSKIAIQKARKKLKDMNMITITKKGYGQILTYSLQKDYSKWKPIPKKVTVTKKGYKPIPKKVTTVTKKVAHKRHYTKDTITKDKYNNEFKSFWKEYPNNADKAEAYERFQKFIIIPDDLQNLMKALKNYKLHLQEEENKDWKRPKNATTWLNKRRWENWLEYETRLENLSVAEKVKRGLIKLKD